MKTPKVHPSTVEPLQFVRNDAMTTLQAVPKYWKDKYMRSSIWGVQLTTCATIISTEQGISDSCDDTKANMHKYSVNTEKYLHTGYSLRTASNIRMGQRIYSTTTQIPIEKPHNTHSGL